MEVKQENAKRRYSESGIKRPAVDFIDLTPTKRPKIENILITSGEQLAEFYKLKKHFVLDRALSSLPIGRYLSQVSCTIKDMAWLETEMRNQMHLTGLDLRGLQTVLVLRLLSVLPNNKRVEEIRLSLVTEEVAYKLAQILHVEQITLLDLSCCSIKASTMVPLLNNPNFTSYKGLKYLDLSHNEIGSDGFNALGLVLKNNSSLHTLLISDVAQEDYSWQSLAEGLKATESLTRLDISYNPLTPSNAQLLMNSLTTNRTIEDLNMSTMSLRGIEVERLATALRRNQNLTKLDLSRNNLGIDGARAVAELLGQNRLKDLDVSSSAFTNTAITTIATALQQNKSLTRLFLAGNPFGAVGLKAIFMAVASHSQIRSLYLRHLKIPTESFTNIALSDIMKNKSLTDIDVRLPEVKNLVNTLVARNKKIRSLDLASLHEQIELKDWTKVEDFFRANPSLKLSDMVNEEIFPKQTRALLQATYDRSQSAPKRNEPVNASQQSPAKVSSSQQQNNNNNNNNTNSNNNNTNSNTNSNPQVEEEGEESEEECDDNAIVANAAEYKPESILAEIAEKKIAIKYLTKEKQDVRKNIDVIDNKIKEVKKDVKTSEAKLAIWKKSMTTPINDWTVTNVLLLLQELKLTHVTRIFEAENIDGKSLLALKSVDMIGLGLSEKNTKCLQRAIYLIENHNSLSGGPDVFKWSTEKLNEWLTENNLPHVIEKFKAHNVTGADLIFLDDLDIVNWLRFDSLTDKRTLEAAIDKLKSTVVKKKIPEEFLCPITHEVMQDPVVTSDGNTYERQAIEQWLKKNNTSPLTNKALATKKLIPNQHLKNTITKFMGDKQ